MKNLSKFDVSLVSGGEDLSEKKVFICDVIKEKEVFSRTTFGASVNGEFKNKIEKALVGIGDDYSVKCRDVVFEDATA